MEIFSLDHVEFICAYGIECATPPRKQERKGLYPTFCRISQGKSSDEHSHFEPEIFFILRGQGQLTIDGEMRGVRSGDLVRIPPFSKHTLFNLSKEDLIFLSLYSEDYEVSAVPPVVRITAAPPTPNGPLHLGHMSGPYLAADVMSRYLRGRGSSVTAHTGTDDHQNYVADRAAGLGLESEVFRRRMRERIESGFQALSIIFDEFIEPKVDLEYQNRILAFAEEALRRGVIQLETLDFPFCNSCDRLLVDSLIDGQCPTCHEPSRGGCENCGLVVLPKDLLHAKCSHCGQVSEMKATRVGTFDLKKYILDILPDLARQKLPYKIQSMLENVLTQKEFKVLVSYPDTEAEGLKFRGLDETLGSTDSTGSSNNQHSEQVLHVWFEMAAHYRKFSNSSDFWIHSFGFDNSFYYLLFIPALLRAVDGVNSKLPDLSIINEFLLLDGAKFSTSRGHAIWADEFVGNMDHLRLYLSTERPSAVTSDFVFTDFQRFSQNLSLQLQNLLLTSVHKTDVKLQTQQNVFSQKLIVSSERFARDMEYYFSTERFELRQASRRILFHLDELIQIMTTGQGNLDSVSKLSAMQVFANFLSPIMPLEAEKLRLQTSGALLGEVSRESGAKNERVHL